MTTKQIMIILLATTVLVSCDKKDDPKNTSTTISVSAQWHFDALGNVVSSQPDGQWRAKTFTDTELGLFTSLDTANLSGTTTPATVLENPPGYNSIYPNPFSPVFEIRFGFSPGFSGPFVFKSVIVDSLLNPIDKKAIRMEASVSGSGNISSSNIIAISPNIPIGKYRIYYTLSSQSNPHFYRSWGNIERN